MKEFQISKRTALRDVEELEAMGLPFYTENGRYGGYKLINQGLWTPVYFNDEEIEAIFFALDALKLLSSTPFEKSYRHIRQKLSATLPESQQEYISKMLTVVNFYGIAPVSKVTDLKLLMTAILSEKIVKMTYSQYEIKKLSFKFTKYFIEMACGFVVPMMLTKKNGELIVVITCQRSKSLMMVVKLKNYLN